MGFHIIDCGQLIRHDLLVGSWCSVGSGGLGGIVVSVGDCGPTSRRFRSASH